jgi:hypothetical protein
MLTPGKDAANVANNTSIEVTYNQNITGLDLSQIKITDENNNNVTGVAATISGAVLSITHDDFDYTKTYTVTIPEGTIQSCSYTFTWSFSTIKILEFTALKIEDGAMVTPYRTVKLSFDLANNALPTHYMASEDSNFAGEQWISCGSEPKYTFKEDENGLKTIYAKLKNEMSETEVLNASIYYKNGPAKEGESGNTTSAKNFNAAIYPNPADTEINILINNEVSVVDVSILSITGQLYKTETHNSACFTIDLSNCPSGVLLIRISDANNVVVNRIIKL